MSLKASLSSVSSSCINNIKCSFKLDNVSVLVNQISPDFFILGSYNFLDKMSMNFKYYAYDYINHQMVIRIIVYKHTNWPLIYKQHVYFSM